jgi:hypothetical protein
MEPVLSYYRLQRNQRQVVIDTIKKEQLWPLFQGLEPVTLEIAALKKLQEEGREEDEREAENAVAYYSETCRTNVSIVAGLILWLTLGTVGILGVGAVGGWVSDRIQQTYSPSETYLDMFLVAGVALVVSVCVGGLCAFVNWRKKNTGMG